MMLNSFSVRVKKSIKKRGLLGFLRAAVSYALSLVVLFLKTVSDGVCFFAFVLSHRRKGFAFKDKKMDFFIHPYNRTWENERSLEIPIVWDLMLNTYGKESRVLELGNVLSHYKYFAHDVIDKYEKSDGVRNVDIVDFSPDTPYDFIFSISTIEHVGYDCGELLDSAKPKKAIEKMLSMLKRGGQLIVTVPMGYNPSVDNLILKNEIPFSEIYFYRQCKGTLNWEPIAGNEIESFKGTGSRRILCVLIIHT